MRMLLRSLCVLPIRLYQRCISPVLPPACRFYPTCSAYAAEAILRHGRAARRLAGAQASGALPSMGRVGL